MKWFGRKKRAYHDIAPDEILMDSHNFPQFDRSQMEGRIARPLGKRTIFALAAVFILIFTVYASRLWILQVEGGQSYTERSENNRLRHSFVFASRGVVYDRNGEEVIWNATHEEDEEFAQRIYSDMPGLAHVLGYVSYPQKDSSGIFYETNFIGKLGIEKSFGEKIGGENGIKIVETDAHNTIVSESTLKPPKNGDPLTLTIDAEMQSKLFEEIRSLAESNGFQGGAGVVMDVWTGEIMALTSYPEYDPDSFARGQDEEYISSVLTDDRSPFLNRATQGLYTPGSIVKPFIALAALTEDIIASDTQILSTGEFRIENPYIPGEYTIIRDWRAHGWVDMQEALAVSSNEYFFTIGGGTENQEGLGINAIEKYAEAFGLGEMTGISGIAEEKGVIPNPTWKARHFNGEPWRLGDTYNTAIGQYGVQVTAAQMARAVGAIATKGTLVTPTLVQDRRESITRVPIDVSDHNYSVIQEGMRKAVTEGTARGLHSSNIDVAAKTGTAEVGITKKRVNSWVIGYFPIEKPQYSFAVVMEKGPRDNLIGATSVMNKLLGWIQINRSDYLYPSKEE